MEGKVLSDFHDPLGKKDYLSIQHIKRYQFACEMLRPGMKVLDIACGTGYGTVMMAEKACDVIRVDIDSELIEKNKKRWNYQKFVAANALHLPFEDNTFDIVVSFETIEHVLNGREFLCEMKRVLKPGGVFICSTPNIKYTAHPHFHLKEYEPEEFFSLLQEFFVEIKKFGQYFTIKDRLTDLFNWYLKSRFLNVIIKILEFLSLKEFVKRLLLLNKEKRETFNKYKNQVIEDSDKYSVVEYKGNNLLRIIIAVGRKDEG